LSLASSTVHVNADTDVGAAANDECLLVVMGIELEMNALMKRHEGMIGMVLLAAMMTMTMS
jgi:hypothetical protein